MTNKTIKFSHTYNKMLNNSAGIVPKKATLLEVFVKDTQELHPRFVDYDTIHFNKDMNLYRYYELSKGKLIILLLKTEFRLGEIMLWTTIRRFSPEKYKYYSEARGREFDIVIEEELGETK